MDTYDGFKRLERSASMVESRGMSDDLRFAPLKRAETFAYSGSSSTKSSSPRSRTGSFSLPEVLYRRFFISTEEGEVDSKSKIPQHPELRKLSRASSFSSPFSSSRSLSSLAAPPRSQHKSVVIVDTFSTGAVLADHLYLQGYDVIRVYSGDIRQELLDMVLDGLSVQYSATLIYKNMDTLIEKLLAIEPPVVAVMAGAETGVELADALSEKMGLRTNGTSLSEARRNKYVMGETIRKAGIRAVKQLRSSKWSEIQEWIEEWNPNPFKVIVKPVDSAGSDDVTLCLTIDEVRTSFGNIIGKINGLGLANNAVLIQEYLDGQEYVVDMVSLDGEHKVLAVWAYDRRAVNGAGFVCFGQRLLLADEPCVPELIAYQKKVLTALGIRNGPTHGEVKWFQGEPVLVEVGARCHGAEGSWVDIENEVYGYNQAQSTIDCYLNPEAFHRLPDAPLQRFAHGCLKWLIVTKEEGILDSIDTATEGELRSMSAYRGHQFFIHTGENLRKTENCFTWAGYVKLAHADHDTCKQAYERVEEMEKTSLFVVQKRTSVPPELSSSTGTTRFVGVVDPFSSGAMIAYFISQQGYKIVAVYSEQMERLDSLQSLIPQGLQLTFDAIVGFNPNISVAISSLNALTNSLGECVAIIAGAETGVELADALSEKMGLRTNGTSLSEARRNKYVMGETIRKAGIRAVKQLRSSKWSEIQEWIEEWNPNPFKVIVKPVDSAGSDGVVLCESINEVRTSFGNIIGKINGLGLANNAVLIQEYLDGQEYVVDMVSLDGEHKVLAVWAYDRRAVNGAGFVCFGQRLLLADEPCVPELIAYQKKVLTALGIRNGPTHGEVKWFQGEPVLVEVGARCHGAEGFWIDITNKVYGYNQVQSTIDCYLNPEAFHRLPDAPSQRFGFGRLLFFIVKVKGTLRRYNPTFLEEIKAMKSFMYCETFLKPGQYIKPTVDCFGFGGIVKLFHEDLITLSSDYDRIREMEECGLFEVDCNA